MRLSEDRFFVNTAIESIPFHGDSYKFDRFGYESHDAIYDVDLRPYGTFFMKNWQPSEITPIHRAIVRHYLKGTR
jgi:hypothetical protein